MLRLLHNNTAYKYLKDVTQRGDNDALHVRNQIDYFYINRIDFVHISILDRTDTSTINKTFDL